MLGISILGIVIFIILNNRKLKLLRGPLFSYVVKRMLYISDTQFYVPVKCVEQQEAYIYLKITGKLIPEHYKLKRNILWDVIEIE